MQTLKERRIDLRLRLANNDPLEIEKICQANTYERKKEMQKRITIALEKKSSFSEKEMALIRAHFPELLEDAFKAEDIMNAQTLRWVHDECSPVEWAGSDADMSVDNYLAKLLDLKDALAFC